MLKGCNEIWALAQGGNEIWVLPEGGNQLWPQKTVNNNRHYQCDQCWVLQVTVNFIKP